MTGFDGGSLSLPLVEIARLRIGFAQPRQSTFRQMLIWRHGKRGALLLGTSEPREHPRFAGFARAAARALVDDGCLATIETGENRAWAAAMVGSVGLVAAGFAGALAFALTEEEAALGVPRAVAAGVAAALCCGVSAFGYWIWSRNWPRRIRSLADLARVLPPPTPH